MDIASEYELDLDLRRRERRFAIDLLLLSLQCVLRRRERLRCLENESRGTRRVVSLCWSESLFIFGGAIGRKKSRQIGLTGTE